MPRLLVEELVSIGLVDSPDNPKATVQLWKRADEYWKRDFSSDRREQLARQGKALPDGSFPIVTVADLRNAIQAFGRAKSKPTAKRHIIARAKALGRTNLLPDGWSMAKMQTGEPGQGRTPVEILMDRPDKPEGVADDQWAHVTKAFDAYDKIIEGLRDEVAKLSPEDPPKLEELPEAVAKQFDDLQRRNEELEKRQAAQADELAKERDERLRIEIAKTISEVPAAVGKASEAADPLFAIYKTVGADEWKWLSSRFAQLQKVIEASDLLKELGVSDDGDPATQIEQLAKEKMKENKDLTPAQARLLVRTERPDLKAAEREAS